MIKIGNIFNPLHARREVDVEAAPKAEGENVD
jgi:hypothetical protein